MTGPRTSRPDEDEETVDSRRDERMDDEALAAIAG